MGGSVKPPLRITTPVIRPWNLSKMARNKELLAAEDRFNVKWQIILDVARLDHTKGLDLSFLPRWAFVQRAVFLTDKRMYGEMLYNKWVLPDTAPEEWIMGLADDSLPVPGIFRAFRGAVDAGADAVMFPMDSPGGGFCAAAPHKILPGSVSGGQVFFKRELANGVTWEDGNPCLDGQFLKEVYENTLNTHEWHFASKPVIYHNQLRPGEG